MLDDRDLTRLRPEQVRAAGVGDRPRGQAPPAEPHGRGQPPRRDVLALARRRLERDRPTLSSSSPSSRSAGTWPPASLSGGEQQMLVLAQALVSARRSCSSTSSRSASPRSSCKRLVPTLESVAAGGVGVLLIEQFAHVALALAETAYVIEGGRIRYSGPAQTLHRPAGAPPLRVPAPRPRAEHGHRSRLELIRTTGLIVAPSFGCARGLVDPVEVVLNHHPLDRETARPPQLEQAREEELRDRCRPRRCRGRPGRREKAVDVEGDLRVRSGALRSRRRRPSAPERRPPCAARS